eukprot:363119-Chlamydomonas_euryale.AAC.4
MAERRASAHVLHGLTVSPAKHAMPGSGLQRSRAWGLGQKGGPASQPRHCHTFHGAAGAGVHTRKRPQPAAPSPLHRRRDRRAQIRPRRNTAAPTRDARPPPPALLWHTLFQADR